ncbi:uracil-DNA glycosylase family protein [Pseudoalteromonas piscicida]|uniref:uracil-DNA glycosylase family protein n=1 Tax=Pseudoalteromonas piscicida TaxID=43662 RepID=UPI001C9613E2|nr:uracil-DNA glycosylase family protein [Pseudoalteromonas piscicida]QZO15336.1 uracil-DNA glycosylase family protein [Pseudoalteromonas piscicida]WMO16719.1 uracil-DNA glycosylase family protein [Pseudoalteromonas piscicida]
MNTFERVRQCKLCDKTLPMGAKPIIQGSYKAKVLIIGQAPGLKAHQTCQPFNDPSGDRLRDWLGVSRIQFYNPELFAIMPMAFCYPGKGKSGDLPPPKICAPTWHSQVLATLSHVSLTLLIGQYAQKCYLTQYSSVTEMVKNADFSSQSHLPLPHPSPRNQIWLKKHDWFEKDSVPQLKTRVSAALSS